MHSIILGTTDFVMGDEIMNNVTWMNDNEVKRIIFEIAQDILIYGGSYIEVLRNTFGKIAKLNVLNFRNVRSNKDNTKFYYSKDFSDNKSWGRCKCNVYDAYDPDDPTQMQSIYLIKNDRRRTYPVPIWCASVIAAEIEIHINEFHLNNINNGFNTFHIVNFNNGIPDDEMKEEIEEKFNEKFTGVENAGRVMLAWNNDKEHAVEISSLELKNYGEQYSTLAERSKNELFVAFRATPILFGLPQNNIGFNVQEYSSAFKLFNKTVVQPIQQIIIQSLENILGISEPITINEFKIDFDV